ncbi:MAG: F0F1 ATP synthase subunit delta [Candidatus Omnitrophica bacterium]|nr:F0F1 ATP synthase subunit delta [Candidatus Omnitrophota bacterium]
MSLMPFIVFIILFGAAGLWVVRQILTKQVVQATSHLQDLSQDYLKKQEELTRRLTEAKQQCEARVTQAQQEANHLLNQAQQEGEAAKAKIIADARQEGERIIAQAKQAGQAMQEERQQLLDRIAVGQACELIQRILPQAMREETHARYLDELIANGLIPLERLSQAEAVGEAQVVSAYPLTPTQRKRLLEKLQTALGASITLQEAVDERIIAGLTITFGHLVLDGSLAAKLREAARHVEDASA